MKFSVFVLLSAVLLSAQSVPEVEITAEPHHHKTIDNQFVRVFYVDVAPHADTLMHWHRHDYIFVTLGPTEAINAVKGKDPVTLKLQDGETHFLPGPFPHIARNIGNTPFHNVTIELMQDEKLRREVKEGRVKWDEDRGLVILHGGTQEILFVEDGVRVSEFELQPGGVVPKHHHKGRHLLVAVSDLDIVSDVEGQGPMPGNFKSGDAKWLPGGYSHTITNTGHHPAKFVTVEFP